MVVMNSEGSPKTKKITMRVTVEEFAAIRRLAFAAGRDMGPHVYKWIQPKLKKAAG